MYFFDIFCKHEAEIRKARAKVLGRWSVHLFIMRNKLSMISYVKK